MNEKIITNEPERLDLRSHEIADDRKQELLRLFPEIRTEGGKLDFDLLERALGETVDVGKERYGMNWPGKADCYKTIQMPSLGTLRPCPEESVNFDTTENLIIEGDNLEVLKLLQKSYLGKVKMIYIDPPYNTGNDFIYPDNYSESLQTYLEYTGQTDTEGRKFSTNTEADGRFHSKWLNMMYPRLYLARNLLREDGIVFISIDDFEYDNLKKLCDEVFGEENFLENIIWKKRYGGGAKEKFLVSVHEYILCYARNLDTIAPLFVPQTQESIERYYTLKDKNYAQLGPYRTHPLEATKSMGERKNLVFPITAPDGSAVMPKRQWLWSRERVDEALKKDGLAFLKDKDGNWSVHTKQYLKDEDGNVRQSKAFSIIDNVFTQHGTNEILNLFGDAQIYSFPKPSKLLIPLLNLATSELDSIVLDFFAGSGSIAHAVLDLNKQDGGNRKFILVQLPEPLDPNDNAQKAAYDFCKVNNFATNIAEITKERVRRVINKLSDEGVGKLDLEGATKQDRGFRVFKLSESNFKPWNAEVAHEAKVLEQQLEMHVDHFREGRTAEDLLYEILLKSGFALTTPVETLTLAGKAVHSVASGALFICLERELTLELVRAMADKKPERVVCLDEGFAGNDQLKANAVQLFKTKGVTSFKTV
ncbi:MAG TPA: site-specific DNA-methyltransferase [Burkholderiales bacterium]|nr:site-specific DNA-methyltransferase [Burkholderiales bacterium]